MAGKNKTFLSLLSNIGAMKVSIDTKEDSHDDIKKVIRMLQNVVGDSQEVFINQPIEQQSASQETSSPFANIFGDAAAPQTSSASSETTAQPSQDTQTEETTTTSESTEDLFAELFSEEELKKMDAAKVKDDDELPKSKDKKYSIDFY